MSLSDINKETHINRPALYKVLPKLQRSGLVSQIQKQKRQFYQAESPNKLLAQFESARKEVADGLEELAQQHETEAVDRPIIKYYEGKQGLSFVFDDVAHTLPKGSEFYRYTARTGRSDQFAESYYAKAREEKELQRLAIVSELKAKQKDKKLNRSLRVIPKEFDLFEDNISLMIYGDKTAYLDYDSKTSFIVESAKIAQFQEKLFKLLWKYLPRE